MDESHELESRKRMRFAVSDVALSNDRADGFLDGKQNSSISGEQVPDASMFSATDQRPEALGILISQSNEDEEGVQEWVRKGRRVTIMVTAPTPFTPSSHPPQTPSQPPNARSPSQTLLKEPKFILSTASKIFVDAQSATTNQTMAPSHPETIPTIPKNWDRCFIPPTLYLYLTKRLCTTRVIAHLRNFARGLGIELGPVEPAWIKQVVDDNMDSHGYGYLRNGAGPWGGIPDNGYAPLPRPLPVEAYQAREHFLQKQQLDRQHALPESTTEPTRSSTWALGSSETASNAFALALSNGLVAASPRRRSPRNHARTADSSRLQVPATQQPSHPSSSSQGVSGSLHGLRLKPGQRLTQAQLQYLKSPQYLRLTQARQARRLSQRQQQLALAQPEQLQPQQHQLFTEPQLEYLTRQNAALQSQQNLPPYTSQPQHSVNGKEPLHATQQQQQQHSPTALQQQHLQQVEQARRSQFLPALHQQQQHDPQTYRRPSNPAPQQQQHLPQIQQARQFLAAYMAKQRQQQQNCHPQTQQRPSNPAPQQQHYLLQADRARQHLSPYVLQQQQKSPEQAHVYHLADPAQQSLPPQAQYPNQLHSYNPSDAPTHTTPLSQMNNGWQTSPYLYRHGDQHDHDQANANGGGGIEDGIRYDDMDLKLGDGIGNWDMDGGTDLTWGDDGMTGDEHVGMGASFPLPKWWEL